MEDYPSAAVGIGDGSKVSVSEIPAGPHLLQARHGNEPIQKVSGEEEVEDYP